MQNRKMCHYKFSLECLISIIFFQHFEGNHLFWISDIFASKINSQI